MIKMKKTILIIGTVALLIGCGAGTGDTEVVLYVDTHSHQTEKPDPLSPVGYWSVDHSYPVFSGPEKENDLAQTLNTIMAETLSSYQCDNGGDQYFSAEVRRLTTDFIRIEYSAMWHCATMPSPDSTQGAINLALPSLDELKLSSQFLDDDRRDKLNTLDGLFKENSPLQ